MRNFLTDRNPQQSLEVWGGLECTVNRVGDSFFDQAAWSGADTRSGDLERIADLGIRTLRMGFNWETIERTGSWDLFDTQLQECRRLGITPIAGLLHHGSGPTYTSLLDPCFVEKFTRYAETFASRYPWVNLYTPINEPQTTARFAALYGHWYPHRRSLKDFVRALINQIHGTVSAMGVIRTVNPEAKLVTTEDAGRTFSTPELDSVREHREHRKWLGTDLLCGRVSRHHPLFRWLLDCGLSEAEVLWFSENPCPPSILGLNYYVTSDRFLDHRLDRYESYFTGGDGYEPLVDIEAVRVREEGIAGTRSILLEAWQRYGIPLVITEAHLGCDADEQMRWLNRVWSDAKEARTAGADVRAVTVWALFGSWNWCHLVTRDTGAYEAGVFDLSAEINEDGAARPLETELAGLVRELARLGHSNHPALHSRGWWEKSDRLLHPRNESEIENAENRVSR